MNVAVATPALLFLLPLALLPLIFPAQKSEGYPSLAAAETDMLSLLIDLGLRIAGAVAIAGLVLGLSGLHRLGQSIERLGEGANIVLLFDRSASMNDTFAGRPPTGEEESKSAAARRFLKQFVASREHDRFGVAAFSTAPMFVLPLSDHKEATAAAVDAIELPGLALTDVGRGLAMAQSMQEADILATQGNDVELGTRAIVLVSDGAAVIDGKLQEKLRSAFTKRPLHLYWIFLRTEGSRGIFDPPKEGDRDTPYAMPERHLNLFFESLKIPYQAFEAENPAAVGEAIEAIGKLERSPIRYVERIPQKDLSGYAYAASAAALLLLLLAKLAETSVAAVPGSRSTARVVVFGLLLAAVTALSGAVQAAELDRVQVLALIAAASQDQAPDLARKDLTGLDLAGVDFKRADLFAADLSGANLKGANLAGANLNRAILVGADLSGADLTNASVYAVFANQVNLSGADLSGARLIGDLEGARLDGAKLIGADLGLDPANQSMVPIRVDLSRANLDGADLSGANLIHVVFAFGSLKTAKLAGARLNWADLSGADLQGADVTGADFTDAKLEGASLAGLKGADSAQGLSGRE